MKNYYRCKLVSELLPFQYIIRVAQWIMGGPENRSLVAQFPQDVLQGLRTQS